jgi:single-strand DNA-binding protein
MLNQVVISGNLGNEPTTKYSNNGDAICHFDLAFNSGKNQTGWIKVKAFKELAETAQEHLSKGDKIIVSGKVNQEQWEHNGRQRKQLMINAYSIEFIHLKKSNQNQSNAA